MIKCNSLRSDGADVHTAGAGKVAWRYRLPVAERPSTIDAGELYFSRNQHDFQASSNVAGNGEK